MKEGRSGATLSIVHHLSRRSRPNLSDGIPRIGSRDVMLDHLVRSLVGVGDKWSKSRSYKSEDRLYYQVVCLTYHEPLLVILERCVVLDSFSSLLTASEKATIFFSK